MIDTIQIWELTLYLPDKDVRMFFISESLCKKWLAEYFTRHGGVKNSISTRQVITDYAQD